MVTRAQTAPARAAEQIAREAELAATEAAANAAAALNASAFPGNGVTLGQATANGQGRGRNATTGGQGRGRDVGTVAGRGRGRGRGGEEARVDKDGTRMGRALATIRVHSTCAVVPMQWVHMRPMAQP